MRFALASAALFAVSAAIHAEPRDVAELFPASTALYAEMNQPDAVGKDLAAFLKGTVLERSAPNLKNLRDQPNGHVDTSRAGLFAALLAPEMLKEAARFKGLAGGIVGFDKHGEPEWLFVMLPGESPLPGFLLRAVFTAHPEIRKVATVEGVDLFQSNILQFQEDPLLPGGGAPMQKSIPVGPVLVNHPNLIVIGSNPERVSAVIRRFKEKEKSASLFANIAFKTLIDQRAKPGILCFADARRLFEQIDRNVKVDRDFNPAPWLALKNLLPPASLSTVTARLEIKDDGIRLQARLKLDEKNTGPLARLLEGAALAAADLKSIASASPFTLLLALPAEQRANRLLAAVDAVVKATGTLGPNASELLQELEEKKLLSREELAQINRIALTFPPVASWPRGQVALPALVLQSDHPDTLGRLERSLPTVLELFGGVKTDAITETINGVKVRSLEAKASPTGQPFHYSRHGSVLGIGTDRKGLAEIVRGHVDGRTSAEISAAFPNRERPALVGVWNWPDPVRGSVADKKEVPNPRQGIILGEFPTSRSPRFPGVYQPGSFPFPKGMIEQFEGLPPLVVSLSCRANEIHFELQQMDPKRARMKAIDFLFTWLGRNTAYGRSTGVYDEPVDLVPLLPAPPLQIPAP